MVGGDRLQRCAGGGDPFQGLPRLGRTSLDGLQDAAAAGFQFLADGLGELAVLGRLADHDQHLRVLAALVQDGPSQLAAGPGRDGVVGPDGHRAVVHAEGHQHQDGAVIRQQAFHCTANSMICSCVARATSVISPVMRPSCITRMRSLMPSTSGNSELIISIALPWAARRLISK